MNLQIQHDLMERMAKQASFVEGYAGVKDHLSNYRTIPEFQFGHKVFTSFHAELQRHVFRQQIKVALLTSYTSDFLIPLLQTDLMLEGLGCEIYRPTYNQVRQEILNSRSGLYEFCPDITIVAIELEDIFPDGIANFAKLTPAERGELSRQVLALYTSLAQSFHENVRSGRGCLLLQNQGYQFQSYDPLVATDESVNTFVREINREIEQLCRQFPSTYLMDYARLIDQHGARLWTDPRLYFTARIPVAQDKWLHMSDAYVRYIKASLNLDVKCIVLDLDNTIWGGVLGEDGIDNIHLGDTYPGSLFRKFQQYLLSLHAHGYILAIASKNNLEDVLEVLGNHRWMLLKQEHFAGMKVNWREKAGNIKELSEEIGISIDHMLFVDDNPVEIEKVKLALPAITCIQLETPPLNFPSQFARLRCFGKLAVTAEDRQRGQWYYHDRQRRDLRQEVTSLDKFYCSLGQRLTVYTNAKKHLSRIVQLTQRTNQFNMTTIRLSERCAEELLNSPDHLLITAELVDRFGANGVVAYVQIRKLERLWRIEAFLMSCRVLGRMLEETLLDHLIQLALTQGVHSMEASFILTRKNAAFADFYARQGFRLLEDGTDSGSGQSNYVLDLGEHIPRNPVMEVVSGD